MTDVYLEANRASTMEIIVISRKMLTIFTEKAPSQMFDWVLNARLIHLLFIIRTKNLVEDKFLIFDSAFGLRLFLHNLFLFFRISILLGFNL